MDELDSFVMAGKVRQDILSTLLKEGKKTPILLAKALKIHSASASRALLALEKKGLVKCVTPDADHPRIYAITELGKKTLEEVRAIVGE